MAGRRKAHTGLIGRKPKLNSFDGVARENTSCPIMAMQSHDFGPHRRWIQQSLYPEAKSTHSEEMSTGDTHGKSYTRTLATNIRIRLSVPVQGLARSGGTTTMPGPSARRALVFHSFMSCLLRGQYPRNATRPTRE